MSILLVEFEEPKEPLISAEPEPKTAAQDMSDIVEGSEAVDMEATQTSPEQHDGNPVNEVVTAFQDPKSRPLWVPPLTGIMGSNHPG